MSKKVAVLLFTYNEKDSLEKTVKDILEIEKELPGFDINVVISDSHSPDGTGELAARLSKESKKVHYLDVGRGIGVGIVEGHRYSLRNLNPDILAQIDADGQVVAIVSRADALRWTVAGWPADKSLGEQLAGQEPLVAYEDEMVGSLADRMAAADIGRVPIIRRTDGHLVGLVARRDLLRVRASVVRHERDRDRPPAIAFHHPRLGLVDALVMYRTL